MKLIYLFISFLLFWHKNIPVRILNHVTDKTDYPKFWSMNCIRKKKTVVQQCSPQNHYHYVNECHLKMWTKNSARIPWFLPNVSFDTHWIYILWRRLIFCIHEAAGIDGSRIIRVLLIHHRRTMKWILISWEPLTPVLNIQLLGQRR